MKTIAIYNNKGGVGKTATAVNLAYISSLEGYKTLIWDLDSQAAATFYFRLHAKIKGGAKKLLHGKRDLDENIKGTDYPLLDILPADDSMRHQDVLLDGSEKPHKRLHKLLKPFDADYDFVFIDCAPSMSLTSESVFHVADMLLIPTIPTTLSMRTLDKLHDFFKAQKLPRKKLFSFFSMVDVRRQMHKQMIEHPPAGFAFASTHIAYMSEIEKMGLEQQPACLAAKSKARASYQALWNELQLRLAL